MKNKDFITGLFCATVIAGAGIESDAEEKKKTNIIFILADDLGYGDLGCYGQEIIKTPNLDKLAANGMRFTQHYSGSTVCGPSRCCLLTGLHTGHSYIRGNGKIALRDDPQDITVARLLKDAGYNTAMIGKSGLACNNNDGDLAHRKGFDYFFGYTSHTAAHWYYPPFLWENGKKVEYPENRRHEGSDYAPVNTLAKVLKYIEDNKERPFFLHYASQIPHASLRSTEKFKKIYRPILKEKLLPPRDKHRHYSYEREPKTTYAAMVSNLDENVGKVISKLEELGIAENTLIIFASDNGSMQEGGFKRAWFKSSGVLRGGKRDLYEGGVRTPMIAYWPSVIKAGQTSDHISAFWDFLPTACDIAGAKTPSNTDGISYLPTLLGEKQKKHNTLYWEFFTQGGKQAVRKGKWKAIRLNVSKNSAGKLELYNLEEDISEKNNVADQYPEVVKEMADLMKSSRTESRIFKFVKKVKKKKKK